MLHLQKFMSFDFITVWFIFQNNHSWHHLKTYIESCVFFPCFLMSLFFSVFFFCCFFNAHRKSHICSLSRTLLKALQKRFFYSLPKAETVLLDSFSVAMAMEQFNQPTCSKTHLHLSLLSFLSRNLPKSLWRRCDFAPLHRTPHMPRFIALLHRGKQLHSFHSTYSTSWVWLDFPPFSFQSSVGAMPKPMIPSVSLSDMGVFCLTHDLKAVSIPLQSSIFHLLFLLVFNPNVGFCPWFFILYVSFPLLIALFDIWE